MTGEFRSERPGDREGGEHDPEVAACLRPPVDLPTPDVWSMITHARHEPINLDATQGTDGSRRGRRRRRRLLLTAAAVLVAVVAGGTAVLLAPERGQRLESPAAQSTSSTNDRAADGAPDDPTSEPSFPDDLEIGMDRTTMSSLPPTGSFLVVFDAGAVVVGADGQVLGHYPGGEVPGFLHPDPRTTTDEGADPPGCERTAIPGAGTRLLFCSDEVGPTVEAEDETGRRRPLASFPQPPDTLSPTATVPGRLTDGYLAPGTGRARPMLLEWIQDTEDATSGCDSTVKGLIVDSAASSTTNSRGGAIRHLDGAGWWDGGNPADHHQTKPLGWAADGEEAYVWQYNGGCDAEIETEEGIYAYRLDGSSRLVVPVHEAARDVVVIIYPDSVEDTESPQAEGAASNLVLADTHPEEWAEWTGPVELGNIDPESLIVDEIYRTDAVMMLGFVRAELGMSDRASVWLTAGDPAAWIAVEDDVAVRFAPSIWLRDTDVEPGDLEAWTVDEAETFFPEDGDELSTSIGPDSDGAWTARFTVAGRQAEIGSDYRIGTESYAPTVTDTGDGRVEIVYVLDHRPTEPATLTVRWRRNNRTIGYRRLAIPPAEATTG